MYSTVTDACTPRLMNLERFTFFLQININYEIWGTGNAEFICLNTLKRAPQGRGRKETMKLELEACKRGKKEGEGCKRKA